MPQFSIIVPDVVQSFAAIFSVLKKEIAATEGNPKIIVFGTTANLVALYAKAFVRLLGLTVYELHSRLSQTTRTRTTAAFKEAKTGILFSSDGRLA